MTVENIDSRIDELNKKINDIEARPTEVYSRIVGYYRSVKNWNNGKSAEYKVRKMFLEPENKPAPAPQAKVAVEVEAPLREEKVEQAVAPATPVQEQDNQADLFAMDSTEATASDNSVASYSFFFRNTCPNCPPVKELISNMDWEGKHINVDEEEGLNAAVEHNVFTAPTVILFSSKGEEIFRADNAEGLRDYVAEGAVAAV
ncbi:MAG: anaerobic ribonucleoside-triphosphate reductase [Spirochaetales bacterium]|nr:anaerobic ribonucleoside-triphosphate reductase [Spirochaetales bacterium]